MSVPNCENGPLQTGDLEMLGLTSPVPADEMIRYRPRPQPRTATPPSTPQASALGKQFQDMMKEFFRDTHQKVEKTFRFFFEGPQPALPAKGQGQAMKEQAQELSEASLILKLFCWSSGLGTNKCPQLLEESLKQYFEEPKSR